MTQKELDQIAKYVRDEFYKVTPFTPEPGIELEDGRFRPPSTGWLKNHSLKVRKPGKMIREIYYDPKESPYMVYTEEPWISPKWKGRKNPHEGWWKAKAEEVANAIAKKVKAVKTYKKEG